MNHHNLTRAELEEIYADAVAQFEESPKGDSDVLLFRIRLRKVGLIETVIDDEIKNRGSK